MKCFRMITPKVTIYRPWNEHILTLVAGDRNVEIVEIPEDVWAVLIVLGETDRNECTWVGDPSVIERLVAERRK